MRPAMPRLPATGGRDVHTVRFPVGRPPATADVLIVGAGPVGLAAATELTARGLRIAVVDRTRTATLAAGGSTAHVLAIDYALRPVLTAMGAAHVVPGWFTLDQDITVRADGTVALAAPTAEALGEITDRFSAVLRERTALQEHTAVLAPSA
ncbi:FAD-dependent oxidoreductase [Streptomyces sp. NPDC018055]|uniref:FAD-dependent oxidoreductase n=1 Tax=Streptomyces sp. NPDC018055 TaxID=3365038 RepID=UPI0037B6CD45